jgi:low affinity Fe/Cu permease
MVAGKPLAFIFCVLSIVAWALAGPLFDYSDSWQLVINTGTTIIAFLMVFLIQNTQNRDTQALHLKLDELIRVTKGAHNRLLDLEELDDEQLERLRQLYERLGQKARKNRQWKMNTAIWMLRANFTRRPNCNSANRVNFLKTGIYKRNLPQI